MKIKREIAKLVEKAGLVLESIEMSGGCHIKARLRRSDGLSAKFFFPLSPSDHRWSKSALTDLRRFSRGDFSPIADRKGR